MRKVYLLIFFSLILTGSFAQTIANWTFEGVSVSGTASTSPVVTTGSTQADAGTLTAGTVFSALHASNTTWSTPAGNGSTKSLSGNTWAIGDYYQFLFSTTGYNNLTIFWDATGSGTGPRDFKVQYSTDGTSFTDATGTNSTYSLALIAWSSATPNSASTRSLDLSAVPALQNAATVYIRFVCNSGTNINGAAIAAGGTSRIDNFAANGVAISSNTISVDAVSSLLFNIDCFTDGTGTVDFSSTGTFNAGNIYTAQLSDAGGSFAAPTNIGTLASIGNTGQINVTIPAGTPSGGGYLVRVVSSNPVVTSSNTSSAITINLTGLCTSNATDYFRSKITGDWNVNTTWQSSTSGLVGTWINATLTPTSAANTVQIRNGHTVTITASVAVDQVQIESGGILTHTGGTITVEDGTGDDIDIQNGGIFRLALVNTPPTYGAGSPVINVQGGGMLRVSAGGMTGNGTGVNINNIDYEHQSILEWAPSGASSFSTGGVTYFPNAAPGIIPIFRSNNPVSMQVGAGSNTVINGVFEAVNSTVTWENAGTKTFRNGIKGAALIDGQNGTIPSGKFIINGITAELGGSGQLALPTGVAMEIGPSTTVTMTSDKTVVGDISLLPSNSIIELGTFDLIVSGNVTNSSTDITSYVRTLSTGVLTLNNVGLTGKLFAVGNTSINPVYITSFPTTNYSARIVEPITPPIFNDNYSVLRTWYLSSSVNTPTTNLAFGYRFPEDCGAGFVNTGPNAELGVHLGGVWNVHQNGLTPAAFIYPGTYIITPTLPFTSFTAGAEVPFAIGNNGSILPINCIISCRSAKQNNTGLISWDVSTCSEVMSFEVQRAVNGAAFTTIGSITPGSALAYSYTDMNLAAGNNLYRIKIRGNTGAVKYSNTVAIINDTKGLLITALSPNPVNDKASMVVYSAKAGVVDFVIIDITGRALKQWKATINEGSNMIPVNAAGLATGIYHLSATTGGATTVVRFIKQ